MPRSRESPSLTTKSHAKKPVKVKSTHTGNGSFPIDRLPSELTHIVFGYLKPIHAANFRLLCRNVAEIGLEYIVPTIHVRLKKKSYDRLSAISEHPVISKHVREIYYETDLLVKCNRDEFENYTRTLDPLHTYRPEPPGFNDSPRARRALQRETTKTSNMVRDGLSLHKVDHAFSILENYLTNQEDMLKSNFFPAQVTEAMKRLPKMRALRMEPYNTVGHFNKEMYAVLGAPLKVSWTDGNEEGGLATVSFLLGAGNAELKIQNFCCKPVDWHILAAADEHLIIMKKGLQHLQNLQIELTVPYVDADTMMPIDPDEGYEFMVCLQTNRFVEFVTSAADLIQLTIDSCVGHPCVTMRLEQIVGGFHWRFLELVSFDKIMATEKSLVSFCSKHSATLKCLALRNMVMTEGTWTSAFRIMRRDLRLEIASMEGVLSCDDTDEIWDMHDFPDDNSVGVASWKRISCYLLSHGGEDLSYVDFEVNKGWRE